MAVIATACGFCVQQIELLRCQYHLFVTNLYCVLVVFLYKANVIQLRTNCVGMHFPCCEGSQFILPVLFL